jgi:hypothetical protein
VEKYGRARLASDDNIHVIRRMRSICLITKATGTHSEYVIHIAFPQQHWLRERSSVLRFYAYIYIFKCAYIYIFTCPVYWQFKYIIL